MVTFVILVSGSGVGKLSGEAPWSMASWIMVTNKSGVLIVPSKISVFFSMAKLLKRYLAKETI